MYDLGKRRKTFPCRKLSINEEKEGPETTPKSKKALFKAVARVAAWTSKSLAIAEKEREEEEMRRRTVPEVTRSRNTRDARAARKSMGAIFKEPSNARVNNSHLLSVAIREDIQKRRLLAKFRFMVRLRMMLYKWWRRHCPTEVSSTHPFYMQLKMINETGPGDQPIENAINFEASYFKANKQMRMSQEAKRILTMSPSKRTESDIYYAMIALRGIDSIADYPLRMQQALATYGMFVSYGPKRIVVKQGHRPEWFYFILFGTVVVATLESGSPYAKTRVTLRRGENFGELAIAHRTARQSTVITMEYTEFLTIDCDTYENIFMAGGVKTINDPDHNRFMRSLYFLKDWPLEKLENNPKSVQFCYFRRGTVMVKDSNHSEWIYIVKSGSLQVYKKLVKCYPTVNRRTGNYQEIANADGYMSFLSQENQYHRYALYNNIRMPPPLSPGNSDSEDGDGDQSGEKENLLSLPLMQRVERLIRPRTATGGVIATYGESNRPRNPRNVRSAKADTKRSRRVDSRMSTKTEDTPYLSGTTDEKKLDLSAPGNHDGKRTLIDDFESSAREEAREEALKPSSGKRAVSSIVLSLLPSKEQMDGQSESDLEHQRREDEQKMRKQLTGVPGDFITHLKSCPKLKRDFNSELDLCAMTRELSEPEDSDKDETQPEVPGDKKKREVTAADLDPEFVLVQTLTKGQAFGLQQVFMEDQPSLFLVSHGAECVMINKKFYKENVDPNSETRLKQQISPYPSDEALQEKLRTRVNWMAYRRISLEDLVKRQQDGKAAKLKFKDKRSLFT